MEISWYYLNPIPIFKDFISHSQRPNPSPSNPNPFSQPKNRPILAPNNLPLHDPPNRAAEWAEHEYRPIYSQAAQARAELSYIYYMQEYIRYYWK